MVGADPRLTSIPSNLTVAAVFIRLGTQSKVKLLTLSRTFLYSRTP
jgi:hypothetical protein